MRAWIALVALAACSRSDAKPSPGSAAASAAAASDHAASDDASCELVPFAKSIPLAEASAAALIEQGLIVVADSGNHGAYAIVDPADGTVREQGALPLPAGVSDDLEGLSSPDGKTITGLVSDGTLLHWTRKDQGFVLDANSRITARRDLDFEGLCLAPTIAARATKGACDGFAASKADGHLYCLRGGVIDDKTSWKIARPKQLADCNYSVDGETLLAAGNVFAADMVWKVDPQTGATTDVGPLGPGNGEVVVLAPGGIVYRFSDLNTSPSLAGKYRCPALAR
jgi:hypothetical protein